MTIQKSLSLYSELKQASSSPRLDAELLLAFILNKPREYLYAHPEQKLNSKQLKKFRELIKKRKKYWPVAYLTGHKEFYGLNFLVTPDVLIPRPASEQIIDLSLKLNPKILVDIGTGSGCLAITLKKFLPQSTVIATDISKPALTVAKRNALQHKVKIKFYQSSLLKALPKKYLKKIDLIVSNPPYLYKSEARKKTLQHEPLLALTAPTGKSPDYWIKNLIKQSSLYLKPGGSLIYESRHGKIHQLNS